ncbi:sulfotransferase family protein [Aestuariibaculum suncheonense]|uniref:Sulfotransferase n=1 Tax=Aestuariibaculum suncheonense TaxID=1028745 RepID=A0A8J6QIQ6_9FLAO|nr:sulfotransferase [Aestuariibaculum suncheonense]MBD0837020.1 sulfotransferase [Aestuariibaculum suncheonense]
MDFFILGNPRSGTTLLRLLLNAHSCIGVPPECGMIQWWHSTYKAWGADEHLLAQDFLGDILRSKKIEDWHINPADITNILEADYTYAEVFDAIYRQYTGKPIIGDKNNYYIHHLHTLKHIYPKAKYIHLVRDGRDVACSYLQLQHLNQELKYIPKVSNNIERIAGEWDANVSKIDNFLESENALVIRYEDVLSDTKKTLQLVCAFLGTAFEPDMLSYYTNNNEPESTLHWKTKVLEPLDTRNFNKFKTVLSESELDLFHAVAGNTLKKYNYVT